MGRLRILVADDHDVIRRGVRALLETRRGWLVCGEATNGREAVEQTVRLHPDVAILDMMMPELNGLEATRLILSIAPLTRIIILTMHDFPELARKVRGAGAQDVVLKTDAHDDLIAAVDRIDRANGDAAPAAQKPIHLAGSAVGDLRHVGAFFADAAAAGDVLLPFLEEGLEQGQRVCEIIDERNRELHRQRLQAAAIDPDRIEVIAWQEFYLHGGRFDEAATMEYARGLIGVDADSSEPARFVGHMEWAAENLPDVRDLVHYETWLNSLVADSRDVVVCAYDLTRHRADLVVDLMRAHPRLVVGGGLHRNSFYVASGS